MKLIVPYIGELQTADVRLIRLAEFLGIHSASDFWPPIVQPAHKGGDHAAHHHVMEMRDDEIGV